MTKRQRMLTAMTGGTPDRVPAAPDTNWMIPARLVGGKFWQVYLHGDPPIWKAYNDCVRYFGVDGFSHHGTYSMPGHVDTDGSSEIIEQTEERIVVRGHFRCPAGELYSDTVFLHDEPPTTIKKLIDDFETQHACIPYLLLGDVSRINFDNYRTARADMGDDGVVGLCMNLPTLLTGMRQPTESAFYDYFDYHEQLSEYISMWGEHLILTAQAIIDQQLQPDFVFFPNSGMITLQSVDIMREYSLPWLKKLTRMFKEAGVVTSLHCCGKERALVEDAALHTDLNCIDPLEIAPMGDCDFAEIKAKFGKKLALKGNLHTTEVMLRMNAAGVKEEALKLLEIGMPGGGFILSTGDQCGRDTPEDNIRTLVEVCETYGRY